MDFFVQNSITEEVFVEVTAHISGINSTLPGSVQFNSASTSNLTVSGGVLNGNWSKLNSPVPVANMGPVSSVGMPDSPNPCSRDNLSDCFDFIASEMNKTEEMLRMANETLFKKAGGLNTVNDGHNVSTGGGPKVTLDPGENASPLTRNNSSKNVTQAPNNQLTNSSVDVMIGDSSKVQQTSGNSALSSQDLRQRILPNLGQNSSIFPPLASHPGQGLQGGQRRRKRDLPLPRTQDELQALLRQQQLLHKQEVNNKMFQDMQRLVLSSSAVKKGEDDHVGSMAGMNQTNNENSTRLEVNNSSGVNATSGSSGASSRIILGVGGINSSSGLTDGAPNRTNLTLSAGNASGLHNVSQGGNGSTAVNPSSSSVNPVLGQAFANLTRTEEKEAELETAPKNLVLKVMEKGDSNLKTGDLVDGNLNLVNHSTANSPGMPDTVQSSPNVTRTNITTMTQEVKLLSNDLTHLNTTSSSLSNQSLNGDGKLSVSKVGTTEKTDRNNDTSSVPAVNNGSSSVLLLSPTHNGKRNVTDLPVIKISSDNYTNARSNISFISLNSAKRNESSSANDMSTDNRTNNISSALHVIGASVIEEAKHNPFISQTDQILVAGGGRSSPKDSGGQIEFLFKQPNNDNNGVVPAILRSNQIVSSTVDKPNVAPVVSNGGSRNSMNTRSFLTQAQYPPVLSASAGLPSNLVSGDSIHQRKIVPNVVLGTRDAIRVQRSLSGAPQDKLALPHPGANVVQSDRIHMEGDDDGEGIPQVFETESN